MGFFDSLDKFLDSLEESTKEDTRTAYTESDLVRLFTNEIEGSSKATNIHQIIVEYIEEYHPDACEWEISIRSSKIKNHGDDTYTIVYRGIIQHIFDSWGKRLDFLMFEVIVNTDKYSSLVKTKETSVKVFLGEL
ncbi:MAG: hypothetical protein IJ963_01330 [Phascolarctobacterium sp.]|nr:hypothetical protein [Phascolarctobacterium sp.]